MSAPLSLTCVNLHAETAELGRCIASRAPLAELLVRIAALGQQRDVDTVIHDLLT